MALDLEKLNKLVTFIAESYVFGAKTFDSSKLKKKKIVISKNHLLSLIEAMREMLDNIEMMIDVSDYGLKVRMLRGILEAYDSLAKVIKTYHYEKRRESDDVINDLLEGSIPEEPEE